MITPMTAGDMADSLKISLSDARKVIPVLELQGYVKPAGAEWMTTLSGETVSGSKPPRYTPARIEDALTSLRSRIAKINRDSKAPYKIAEAVAFGDCLSDRARVQSADVGIQLAPRRPVSETRFRKRAQSAARIPEAAPGQKLRPAHPAVRRMDERPSPSKPFNMILYVLSGRRLVDRSVLG